VTVAHKNYLYNPSELIRSDESIQMHFPISSRLFTQLCHYINILLMNTANTCVCCPEICRQSCCSCWTTVKFFT